MPHGIEVVTVIGAGTMGAAIAGHLANAGLSVNLLDVVPEHLLPEEEQAGLALESDQVRNRIVRAGFERMVKARPANLYVPSIAGRIRLGNLHDDFDRMVGEADWVLEAIVELPGPKQALMARIESCARADAIVSTNTSGIPVSFIADGRSPALKRRFLGTHFFNPPRYLRLLELIPASQTDGAVVQRMARFCEQTLGKGVVICKDTPNFIANRMLAFIQSDILDFSTANGYTVEEVDALTGPLLGRPRTATFRLNDVVGIDIMALVIENLYPRIPEDEDREILRSPNVAAILETLQENGLLGAKTGQGFYKTLTGEQGDKTFWGLDLRAAAGGELDYCAPARPRWDSVDAARTLPLPDRLRVLVEADDAAGSLVWHTIANTLAYASKRIPEIAGSLADIDNAMKWGFAWEMGPFEIWDALGVRTAAERMQDGGLHVAPWVEEMLDSGVESFYAVRDGARAVYSPLDRRMHELADGGAIHLSTLRSAGRAVEENPSASMYDVGDGVLLVEFHSKMNTFDEDVFRMLRSALERLHGDAAGLVVGNQGPTFSAGLNLAAVIQAVQSNDFAYVERVVREGQDVLLALRQAPSPVVVALFQRALGGGLEIALAADRVVAHAETYAGLVEVGVGIVPGWGGCKEMVRRHVSPHMQVNSGNPSPHLRRIFETIGFARVSTSAQDAVEIGYLSPHDRIVMNLDHLLGEAKKQVLMLAGGGYRAPDTAGTVYAAGRDMLAAMRVQVHSLLRGGYISEYDAEIAGKLAHVLCGGEISAPAWMDEQYFLDLEREALLALAGQEKTVERIVYMLQNGKPLRN